CQSTLFCLVFSSNARAISEYLSSGIITFLPSNTLERTVTAVDFRLQACYKSQPFVGGEPFQFYQGKTSAGGRPIPQIIRDLLPFDVQHRHLCCLIRKIVDTKCRLFPLLVFNMDLRLADKSVGRGSRVPLKAELVLLQGFLRSFLCCLRRRFGQANLDNGVEQPQGGEHEPENREKITQKVS